MYKVTYGELLKNYITSYETTGKLYKMDENREFVLDSDTKHGHKMNLISFKLYWLLEGRTISRQLPRKKKKRLERLFILKYNKLRKLIDLMED